MSVQSFGRVPFQLLEITLISAQDLSPASKSMQTYAVAWVNPERRLTTRVDSHGHTQPSWNDKFVFRLDQRFLSSPTSSLTIDIFAVSWLRRDVKLGSVRVLLSTLLPPDPDPFFSSTTTPTSSAPGNMRFVALQIRRPSGRPQGILNVGVTLLDSTMRSMPLYTELSASAVGYRDLMDARRPKPNNNNNNNENNNHPSGDDIQQSRKPLRRTQSERTDNKRKPSSSLFIGSVYNGSVCGSAPNGSDVGFPMNAGAFGGGNGSVCSDLGPSPSVVAEAVARGLYRPAAVAASSAGDDDAGSSILGDWTETSSVEGLRSKLERWRTEMPPIYDRDDDRRIKTNRNNNVRRRSSRRRHTDGGGGGLFSCFANAYGCEFSISCGGGGGGGAKTRKSKRHGNGKAPLTPSEDNMSRSYV